MIRIALAVVTSMAIACAILGCVQVQPCPPNSDCRTAVVINTNIMATVPVSALTLPGLP